MNLQFKRIFLALAASFLGIGLQSLFAQSPYTVFTPSPNTQIIYVSSSRGSDANSGLSMNAPVKTLYKGHQLLRDNSPDWMLLKNGDIWSEAFPGWRKSGGTSGQYMRIGSYKDPNAPSDDRPVILSTVNSGEAVFQIKGFSNAPFSYLAVTDLNIRGPGNGTGGDGMWFQGHLSNILIENNLVEGMIGGIGVQTGGFDSSVVMQNIKVKYNVIYNTRCAAGARCSGLWIQTAGVGNPPRPDGSKIKNVEVIGNVFDRNGVQSNNPDAAFNQSHNVYLGYFDSNESTPSGQLGNWTENFLVQDNIFGYPNGGKFTAVNGIFRNNLGIKPAMFIMACCDKNSQILDNVVTESSNFINGSDPAQLGGVAYDVSGVNLTVKGNIATQSTSGTGYQHGIQSSGSLSNAVFENNIIYNWFTGGTTNFAYSGAFAQYGGSMSNVLFKNNRISQSQGGNAFLLNGTSFPQGVSFVGNRYHQSGPGAFLYQSNISCQQFLSQTNDTTGACIPTTPDPNNPPTMAGFMSSIGTPNQNAAEAFLAEARKMSRANYRLNYTAPKVNDYMRASFSATPLPSVSVVATDPNASEPSGSIINNGAFTLSRTGPVTAALTVSFSLQGAAVNGTDYIGIPLTATFTPGASTALISVIPRIDNVREGTEHVRLVLTEQPANYLVPAATGTATVAIADVGFCKADYDANGVLNVLDFLAFQNDFAANRDRADTNADGLFNVLDYSQMSSDFNAGCPADGPLTLTDPSRRSLRK